MINFHDQLAKITKPLIIGIAGDSGSGKTTYSNGIRRLLGSDLVKTITMDGYHKENREERKISGKLPLDPEANKLDLFYIHLSLLKQGKKIELPIYNHKTGDFEKPALFSPSPIIIIEGLHALYPDFLPLLDFTIFVDPNREVKWEWKYERDVKKRHHSEDELSKEMLKREAAYKRWIDFQKTSANIVVKINPTTINNFAKYELLQDLPKICYKVELIMETSTLKLPNLQVFFDLSSILSTDCPPFLLAAVPSLYWGKKVAVVHLDGLLSEKTIKGLEIHIATLTGIPIENMLKAQASFEVHEQVTATQFAQLLIGWRFLEFVNHRIE